MFSWLEGLISSIASSIGSVFEGIGETIVNAIWDSLMKWLFNAFYDSVADVFTQMGDMGAEIFDLSWIESTVRLFFLFGWVLFGVGVIVAAFDLAIEYQNGRATIKSTMLNVLKGFFAANLVTVVPVELYKFCISLQNVFLKDLAADFVGTREFNLGEVALKVLAAKFGPPTVIEALEETIPLLCGNEELLRQQSELSDEMGVLVEMTQTAVAENARIALDQTEYQKRYDGLVNRYDAAKAKYDVVTEQIADRNAKQEILTSFLDTLRKVDGAVSEFDEVLWSSTVDFITVFSSKDIRITFKGGIEIQL